MATACAALRREEAALHTKRSPVHGCALAPSSRLVARIEGAVRLRLENSPRAGDDTRDKYARCDHCGEQGLFVGGVVWSCTACDWDICKDCYECALMPPAEASAFREAKRAREKKELREAREAEKRREAAERKREEEALVGKVPAHARDPPRANRTRSGKGFTVWRAHGFENNGWHRGNPPIDKEFDTSYATVAEANARARFVFYRDDPWGLGASRFRESCRDSCDDIVKSKTKDGLRAYECAPPDSGTWKVGVVPDAAFGHLDDATGDGVDDARDSEEGRR